MGFFDLNIPYHESDRHATDTSSLRGRRLKLALKAMELGYTGIAFNRTLKGVMSESDRCSTPLFPLTKLTPSSSSFFASVKFHRELLNVAVSSPFRQYTRLTVIADMPSQALALNSGNPVLKSYDIVAVRPMNQNAFDQACQTSEVNMIAIDFSVKLPFRLKQQMVKAAIKRGVFFEITYSGLIADVQSRRQMISNCKLLVDWTRGKNLILCSAATSATELRGPEDVANLFSLLGLPRERAKAAISKNCRSLLANALRKKQFYKEAVKVEEIPPGRQVNPAESAFDDWLKWDPISSGEGDLLLDDMEKSFAISKTVKENVKTINFTSNMNGLPVHGLQIKDLIRVTEAALEPPDTNDRAIAVMETARDVAVENTEDQVDLNPLHEEQSCMPHNKYSSNNLSRDEGGVIVLPEGQPSSSCATDVHLASGSKDSEVPLDYVPKAVLAVPPLTAHGQDCVDNGKIEHPDFENSALPSFPTYNGKSTHSEDAVQISDEKLKCSNGLESNLVTSEILLQDTPSPVNEGDSLTDGVGVHVTKTNSLFTNSDVCLSRSISSDVTSQDVFVKGGPYSKMSNSSVKLGDALPVEGLLNVTIDTSEPIKDDVMGEQVQVDSVICQNLGKSQAGRERTKRNPHKPFLFPFKRFLKPRPFRKSRK